jgi:membrane-associated phospholipid phosphatase
MRKIFIFCFLFVSLGSFAQNLDVRILNYINSPKPMHSDKFYKFMSNTSIDVVVAAPVGLALAGYFRNDNQMLRNAGITASATLLNLGITMGLKYTVNRQRPFKTYPDLIFNKVDQKDPSFPSGHTSTAFATATSLSLAYPKWYVIVPSYAWASTVAYSRMHLGVHYPTDIIGGIVIGVLSSFISYKADKWLYSRNMR